MNSHVLRSTGVSKVVRDVNKSLDTASPTPLPTPKGFGAHIHPVADPGAGHPSILNGKFLAAQESGKGMMAQPLAEVSTVTGQV